LPTNARVRAFLVAPPVTTSKSGTLTSLRLYCPRGLSDTERQSLVALGRDVRQAWSAPTTTDRDRKELLRTLIEEVTIVVETGGIPSSPGADPTRVVDQAFDMTFPLPREGPRVRILHLPPLLPSRPLHLLRNDRSDLLLPINLPPIGSRIGVDSRERQGTSPAGLPPTISLACAREAPPAPPRLAGSLRTPRSGCRHAPHHEAQRGFPGPPSAGAGTGGGGFPHRGARVP
jgi:hypothetical protein